MREKKDRPTYAFHVCLEKYIYTHIQRKHKSCNILSKLKRICPCIPRVETGVLWIWKSRLQQRNLISQLFKQFPYLELIYGKKNSTYDTITQNQELNKYFGALILYQNYLSIPLTIRLHSL